MDNRAFQRRWGWLALLAAVAGLAWAWHAGLADLLTLDQLKARQAGLGQWVAAHRWLAAAAFFVLYVAVAAASLPGAAVLTIAAGALFGLLEGSVLVSFASTIGASLAFLVARFALRDRLRQRYRERLQKIDAGMARDGWRYLLSLRLVPVFPFFLVNLLAGLTALPLRTFYWVSQLGMLPATIVYVYAGTQLARIDSLSGVLSPGLLAALVLLGLLPLVTRRFTDWLAARRVYHGHRKPRRFDYNLLVIGAGSAGLVSAYIAATVKARVGLVEKSAMGGDCLNTGCVPSKTLLRTARLLAEGRDSQRYGVRAMAVEFDFADAMARVQQVIARIAPHDSIERYTGLGVEVITGEATVVSPWEIDVGGQRLSARSLIIATGARPLVPPIPGLDSAPYLTSDTVWALRELPQRLLVLGGGPIGCELAQAFARFGSQVTVVEMAPRLLGREDADAAELVACQLASEGVHLAMGHKALRVEGNGVGGRWVVAGQHHQTIPGAVQALERCHAVATQWISHR